MPLLRQGRRLLLVFILAALCAPLVGIPLTALEKLEGDASAPGPLALDADWTKWPEQFDKFFKSHFGFRAKVVRTNALLHYAIRSPTTPRVFYGLGDQLFYADEKAALQSAGLLFRRDQVNRFVSLAVALDRRLSSEGVRFIVVSPPNPHTIEKESLPVWAAAADETELAYALAELPAKGVLTVDLRPVLRSERQRNPVFHLTDTHWNYRGALVSLNAVMSALGHREWVLDPDRALGSPTRSNAGDLARLLGLEEVLSDVEYPLDITLLEAPQLMPLSIFKSTPHAKQPSFAFAVRPAGPSILVIGDSSTRLLWRPFLTKFVARFAWIYHQHCNFDFATVEPFHPDIVILAPVERYLPCSSASAWPRGLSEPPRAQ